MKILVASDFYSEFELYETSDPNGLKDNIKRLINGEDVDISKHTILGTHDTIDTQEAIAQADKIIYTSELMDNREEQRQ